ncbi:TonB-dependent receptor [Mucilaginibacter conchicola]|uniref:TonB-dependent receptor n=1 Tax=Mucilaginibacter conchicola TaxID=2303333 RepID=A0A372NTA1_9SPHI|nr:TonB-dependent receptor [Mucilaginibacter conchicola]RFZ92485.1 TonB-dependent receptor [Mucilaginibacter conchicola]
MLRKLVLTNLVLVAALQLQAQVLPKRDTAHLKEVVVTYQADKLTPVTFQNLNGNVLKAKSTGQEPTFLLSETPSITVYSDAGSTQGYSYFRMRGIDQTRINISLDGMPLSEPEDQGAYFSNYPDIINSVSKIQIQRGIGTSKNGVAGYGGSVQLFSPNLNDSAYTQLGAGYGSFNSHRVFAAYNSGMKNNKAFYIRASQVYSDRYKYNSSNNSQSVFMSGSLAANKSIFKINAMVGHQQNQLAWLGVSEAQIAQDRRTNVNENEHDNFTQALAQLQHLWSPNNISTLQTSVYYTFLNGNNDFNPNSFVGLPSTDEMYNYAFRSNLVGLFSNYTYSKGALNWTTGIHGNIYDRRHIGSERTAGRLYQNTGYKDEFSAFTKADYTIGRLTLFADAQYRYATFSYTGDVPLNRLDWNFFNPKAGLSYKAANNLTLYYSIGRTGREPTRNDMFGGSDNLLADDNGNAAIAVSKPEFVVDQELGLRHQSGNLNLNLNFYYMNFKNEIVLNGQLGPNGLALTNEVDRSYRTGAELSITYKVNEHISLINNSSYNYSRIKEQSQSFTPILTPPVIVNQEVVYTGKKFLVGLAGRYQSRAFINFANSAQVNQYFLLNARAQYTIGRFELGVFLNNVTNAKYFNNGYVDADGTKKYFVQAPTNYYTSVKYTF